MHWHTIANGGAIGTRGSESGLILRDEELDNDARITLEKDCLIAPFAITCGIYGWMAHTRFFSSMEETEPELGRMKAGIESIVQIGSSSSLSDEALRDVVVQAISEFIQRFP